METFDRDDFWFMEQQAGRPGPPEAPPKLTEQELRDLTGVPDLTVAPREVVERRGATLAARREHHLANVIRHTADIEDLEAQRQFPMSASGATNQQRALVLSAEALLQSARAYHACLVAGGV